MKRLHGDRGDDSETNDNDSKIDKDDFLESVMEEYTCGICYELMVLPTTLNCGHSFCRHCLARWFDIGSKAECPSCRQGFSGLPMVNVHIKASLIKLFPVKYTRRKGEVLDDHSNKKAIEEFEEILKKRHRDNEFSNISGGFILGILFLCILASCVYLAFYWGSSDLDLLVHKPINKWTTSDVTYWLKDLGLHPYLNTFEHHAVNGRMLLEVQEHEIEELFGINNMLHKRTFISALEYAKAYGVKPPSNLWEYKALYSGYTTFLLYGMGHTPRLALLYLYKYDEESLLYYQNVIEHCNHISINETVSVSRTSLLKSLILPYYYSGKFVWCFMDVHYWTSRFLLVQCLCKGTLDVLRFFSVISNWNTFSLSACIGDHLGESILMTAVYLVISWLWFLVPTVLRDALFYAEVYFSSFFYLKELMSFFR